MVSQAQPRPIGQTTITRHPAPVRVLSTQHQQQQRMINATVSQIRPGTTTIVQTSNLHHQLNPPALQPVSATTLTQGGFTPGGAQVGYRYIFFLI